MDTRMRAREEEDKDRCQRSKNNRGKRRRARLASKQCTATMKLKAQVIRIDLTRQSPNGLHCMRHSNICSNSCHAHMKAEKPRT